MTPCYHLVHEWVYRCPSCGLVGVVQTWKEATCRGCNASFKLDWYPDMNDNFFAMIKEGQEAGLFSPQSADWVSKIWLNRKPY